jgi:hypothetical protein
MLPEATAYKRKWQLAQKKLRDNKEDCAFVYVHLEADTGNPFYVGIGIKNERPWQQTMRNKTHVGIVKNHGMRAEIVVDSLSHDLAGWWERRWINALRKLGYRIANFADGGAGGAVSGEKNHHAKLTEKQVIEILESTDSPAKMSKRFGINGSTIREIRKGDIWHNVYVKANKPETYDDDRLRTKENHPLFGIPKTEKTKQKLRVHNLGSKRSEEFKNKMSLVTSGSKNPRAKISEELAQSVLDFNGTHADAARNFNLPYSYVVDIRTGRSWKHLKPSREA